MRITRSLFMAMAGVVAAVPSAQGQPAAPASSTGIEAPVAPFPPEARIGFVDFARVAQISREGRALSTRIDEVRTRKASEVEARGKDVAALESKLAQSGAVLNEAAREQLRRQFERAQVDFQRFSEDADAELQQVRREVEQAFLQKARPVIGAIAREKSLWLVLSAAESGLLYRAPTLDLSDEIARRIDTAP